MMSFNRASVVICLASLSTFGCVGSLEDMEASESSTSALDDAPPQDPNVPGEVTVDLTREGCGNTGRAVATHGEAFSILFDRAHVNNIGPETLDCRIVAHYRFPAGFTFKRPLMFVRGAAQADADSSARVTLSATLGGAPGFASFDVTPGFFDEYEIVLPSDAAQRVPCGATEATIQVQIGGTPFGTGTAFAAIESLDAQIEWERCQ